MKKRKEIIEIKKKDDKKEKPKSKKTDLKVFLIVLLILIVLIGLYYLDVFNVEIFENLKIRKIKECQTEDCFEQALEKCEKVSYIYDSQNIWLYEIKGEKEEKCQIYTELLQVKYGILEADRLEGKGMLCNMNLGSLEYPGKDLSKCSGELKEEVQEIIIERMHSHIVENIGKVSEELQKVL